MEHPDKTLVKVWAPDPKKRRGIWCRHCGQRVEWFQTVNRARPMLFNAGAQALKQGQDPATGQAQWFLDRQDCHWNSCPSTP